MKELMIDRKTVSEFQIYLSSWIHLFGLFLRRRDVLSSYGIFYYAQYYRFLQSLYVSFLIIFQPLKSFLIVRKDYLVQSNRFIILEEAGCNDVEYTEIPTILILHVPRIILSLISILFSSELVSKGSLVLQLCWIFTQF